ncbi:MAG: 30S ribosomal protein S20 [Alphaproteobacteria bacterium MarineAlpha3_Bin5]|nr:30S ribosomal protein S20 [Magnetovibrio sp.]PPR79768.1 MAG: 30S ribosomal protein S20 [Alphaproteobacteria bacterium MarineAlpha3_Bin5]
MANHASAKKRIRQTNRRTQINGSRRSSVRTYVRKVEEAIESANHEAASTALRVAEPQLARGAQKGVIDRNMMRRKLSRLSVRVKKLKS